MDDQDDLSRPRDFSLRDLRAFREFVAPVRGWGALALLLSGAGAAAAALLPLNGKLLIDFVVLRAPPEAGGWLAGAVPGLRRLLGAIAGDPRPLVLAMAALGVAAGAAGVAREYAALRFKQGIAERLQGTLFERLLRFPPEFFRGRQSGYLASRVTDDVEALEHLFAHSAVEAAARCVSLALGAAILFALSVRLALVAAAFLPLIVAASLLLARGVRRASRRELEAGAEVAAGVQEAIAGVEVVKSHAAEERESRRVGERVRRLYAARLRGALLELLSTSGTRAAQFASALLVLWVGAREMAAGRMSVGDYVAFTTYAAQLAGSVGFFATLHIALQPMLAAAERVRDMLGVAPERAAAGGGVDPGPVRGAVAFEGVSFAYPGGPPVLRDASFAIAPGETVALLGRSGAGKTTVANLLLGFLAPTGGRILLDGRDCRELDPRRLRERIGVVHQEAFLFEASVAENIRYGRPGATPAEVEAAARRARIHDEIAALPGGYDTVVGERGARLSVGQRQRVSIARALLKDPPLLVLDEPGAALDREGEERLRESMREVARGRTVLLITHRAAMADLATRALLVEGGRVVDGASRG